MTQKHDTKRMTQKGCIFTCINKNELLDPKLLFRPAPILQCNAVNSKNTKISLVCLYFYRLKNTMQSLERNCDSSNITVDSLELKLIA